MPAPVLRDVEGGVPGAAYELTDYGGIGPYGPGTAPLWSRVADYETGDFSQVDGVGAEVSTVSTVTIDATHVHAGTKAVKLHVPGGGGVGYARTFYEFDGAANLLEGAELWGEVAVWLPSNWLVVKQSSVDFLRWDSYVSDDGATLWPSNLAAYVAVTQFSNGGGDGIYLKAALKDDSQQSILVGPLAASVLVSGWNVIRAHVILSATPGIALGELWINAVKQGASGLRTLFGPKPINRLRGGLVATGGGQSSTLDVWMDDFKSGIASDPASSASALRLGERTLSETASGLQLDGTLLVGGSLAATTLALLDTARTSLMLAGGLTFAGDSVANFYHAVSGVVSTDAALRAGGELRAQTGQAGEVRLGGLSGSGQIEFVSGAGAAVDATLRRWGAKQMGTLDTQFLAHRAAATDAALDASYTGSVASPFRVYAGGQVELGDGVTARDVRLRTLGGGAETLAIRDAGDTQYRDLRVRNLTIGRLPTRPRYTATRNAAGLSIPASTWTTVDIDFFAVNTDNVTADVVTASLVGDYVQIQRACVVLVTGVFRFPAGATNSRYAGILHQDSTGTLKGHYPAGQLAAISPCACVSVLLECAALDRLLLQAFQDTGGALGPAATGEHNVALRVLPEAA